MTLKNSFFVILFIGWFDGSSQNIKHNLDEYQELIRSGLKYYCDSLNKGNKEFFIEAYISKIDTIEKKLKVVVDYSYYNPLFLFNPTHIITINNRICVIRFDKSISNNIIHRLGYSVITSKDISQLKKLNKQYVELNNAPTYSSHSFVFRITRDSLYYKWYDVSETASKEDRVLDYEYSKMNIKYEDYLKNKLKEYGY